MSVLQKVIKGKISRPKIVLLYAADGIGKCFKAGTKVLMYDGSILPVELLQIGDRVMGWDSTPRTVLSTHEGRGVLYKVIPKKGEPWFCNENHILTLADHYKNKDIVNVSVKEWLDYSESHKRHTQLCRAKIEFKSQEINLDPYFVGLWIGDGTARSTTVQLHKPDIEILPTLDRIAEEHGLTRKTTGIRHTLSNPDGRKTFKRNSLLEKLSQFVDKRTGEKLIPKNYLINERSIRLSLLAGLLDTDGHLYSGCFEFSSKCESLANDVLFLARSLGFGAYIKEKIVNEKTYYRIVISGDINEIPCKIERKIAPERIINKDVLKVGFNIVEDEENDWYGFETDGDHKFVLHDFTIVHNSTWASQAPNPIFLGVEDGSSNLDVARFPQPQSWKDVLAAINALKTEKHDYKTLVIDSLDWLEPILHKEICMEYGVNSIEKAAGGYGKGYLEAVNKWAELTRELSALRDLKMNVVLIAHAEVVRFSDPMMQTEYDRFQLKLFKKSAALLREFCDAVLFATYEMFTKKDGGRTRAFGEGVRIVYTERRPGFDAKNRYGLPFQLPLDWAEFEKACESGQPHSPTYLRSQIIELVKEITDQELKKKIEETVEKAGIDSAKLEQIKNRILVILEQKE